MVCHIYSILCPQLSKLICDTYYSDSQLSTVILMWVQSWTLIPSGERDWVMNSLRLLKVSVVTEPNHHCDNFIFSVTTTLHFPLVTVRLWGLWLVWRENVLFCCFNHLFSAYTVHVALLTQVTLLFYFTFLHFQELPANSVLLVYLSATGVFPTGHSDYEGKMPFTRPHVCFPVIICNACEI